MLCVEWSAVAFSTDLGLRSEVGRRFGEGHSSELSSNRTILVVTRRDRTWRSATGAMAASSQWRAGRWRARLGSVVSVSTIKYRAVSALAMLGVERACYAWHRGGPEAEGAGLEAEVFPPTLVKEDEALPETADARWTWLRS